MNRKVITLMVGFIGLALGFLSGFLPPYLRGTHINTCLIFGVLLGIIVFLPAITFAGMEW